MGYISITRYFELLSNLMTIFLPILIHFSLTKRNYSEVNNLYFIVPVIFCVLWIVRFTKIPSLQWLWDINEIILVVLINMYFLFYILLDRRLLLKRQLNNFHISNILFSGIYIIWFLNLILLAFKVFYDGLHPLIQLNVSLLFSMLSFRIIWHRIEKNGFFLVEKMTMGKMEILKIIDEIKLEKYYQDPNLTIRTLASKIDIPYYELSKGLNEYTKKNFNTLINELRVEDVIDKIKNQNNKLSIWGLAQNAGFNSRTTFYKAFKKKTGKNPSEMKA